MDSRLLSMLDGAIKSGHESAVISIVSRLGAGNWVDEVNRPRTRDRVLKTTFLLNAVEVPQQTGYNILKNRLGVVVR